ncbi:hypothetical protein LTR01_001040 [Friedmanniomyces endolithicus]|nr:hypothetical protein LTR01_001040 [Friedmanniomyces endolithicus]
MPLELHPLEESDMGVAYELMWETFKPDIMGLMYPDGINDAIREWSNSKSLASWRKDPEKYKKNKVIDTDLPDDDPFGKIVGVADWEFYPKYRSKEEREKSSAESEKDGLPPLINETMMKDFMGQSGEAKEEQLGGKPFVYLHILATHPKHHRRGVGAMHLRWGFEQAEKLGLPVYLESSPIGRPLYERNGFEIKGWLPFDGREYGAQVRVLDDAENLPLLLNLNSHTAKHPKVGPLARRLDASTTRVRPVTYIHTHIWAYSPRKLQPVVMESTPNIVASGRESTDSTISETPPTHPEKEKEVAKLLGVVVDHARSAEDGVRLIRRMVDLAYRKHGLPLLEDEHVRALMVAGSMAALSQSSTRPRLGSAPVRRGDISRSLQVLVDRTACAASAVRMLQELTRLTCQRYGRAVVENEHIAMMNADGTLDWIGDSFSDELVQALNVAVVTSNEDAVKTRKPFCNHPESSQTPADPTTSQALAGPRRKRLRRGGRGQRRGMEESLNTAGFSFSDERVHLLDAALATSNDEGTEIPESLRTGPKSAPIPTGPAASQALAGSKRRRSYRGGRTLRKKADRTSRCIDSSSGSETVKFNDAALARGNDDATETPSPLQTQPEIARNSTSLATTLALAGSKRKWKQRGGRKHRRCDPDLPILTSLAAESMVLAKGADLLFLALIYDRLRKRCTAYGEQRMSVPDETRLPPSVFQGRTESCTRVNYDPTTRAGLEAVLISAYSRLNRIYAIESALKLFVRWNPALFPEFTECEVGRTNYARIAPGSFRSVLDVIRNAEGQDLSIPSDPSLREALCSILFEIVKARVLNKCPGSDLLQAPQTPAIKVWQKCAVTGTGVPATTKSSRKLELCLAIPEPEAPQPYFRSTLLACVLSGVASDAGIEAALEVQLYRLVKKEPRAFPELADDFAAGSLPLPTAQRYTALTAHADSDQRNHDRRSQTLTSSALDDFDGPPAGGSQGAKAFET